MADTPTGTVTFLFTDIEGSTRLWEEQPDAMRLALAGHDSLVRAAIETNSGVVFKTVGDAFCAAFATAADAAQAALAGQRSLSDAGHSAPDTPHRLRVRMALHTGEAERRDGDYFGPALNRVARLLAAGHGGQVLLSGAAREAVGDRLPDGATLRDRGSHRLKDLQQPEQLFQLLHPDLAAEFPPLRTLSTHPNNLPQQLTSFIGREREKESVRGLLAQTRLLTLTGSGGTGKTRLALQVAADLLDDYSDGVWFAEFAPLTDPSLVPQTVAGALGLTEEPGKPVIETLTEHLKTRKLLLLADNCEHLLVACATLAESLLRSCPNVTIVATSRERLGVGGETTFRVPALSLPDPKRDTTPAQLGVYESVRLFVERGCAAQPTLAVTNENARALAAVCHRLDGIPLAIELAAARARSLTIEEINSKLDQRFRLLTGGSRSSLPRQQTLRALIDWSYDLLSEPERALLQRLSVFAGGWTLEAAEGVCRGEGIEDWEVLDLQTGLVDKSLVVPEPKQGQTRYRLLETVRHYARDRLKESDDGERWRARHRDHFLALAEEAEPELKGAKQAEWLERLEVEHDNLRAALEWSAREPEGAEAGLRIAGALSRFWYMRGHQSEGRLRLEGALGHENAQRRTKARADALNGAGSLASLQGDYPAARTRFEESLAIRRELGDRLSVARSLGNLGGVVQYMGDLTAARAFQEESLAIARELGDRWGIAWMLCGLGCTANCDGDYASASVLHAESLAISRELGDRSSIANTLTNLGDVSNQQGDYVAARAFAEESLVAFKEMGQLWGIAGALEGIATAAGRQGYGERAARLWGAAECLRETIGMPMPPQSRETSARSAAAARHSLGEEAFAAAWQEGRALTMEQAVDLALGDADREALP